MIDASIALLKCVIDYGLCIWAFSWFAKRKSENRALFLGSIFLSSLFLFGINMLEIPWLNTIVSAFTLLVLFLVVFYTRWQQALPLALILVTLCVICEFTPPLIMKRIELRVFRQHEQIVVLLANTYNKANTRSNTYALHPHHEHGYGIQNIKRVIRKYNGTYLVKKEDVYKLMISFPLDVGNVKI